MKTIGKALDVLESFLGKDAEIGLSEIARRAGMNISTAHRVAVTLLKRGYLNQRQKRQKYSLSTKLLQFSHVLNQRMKVRDIALPILDGLNKMVGESVNIAILNQNQVVYIEHIESNQSLRTFTQVGNRVPLHCTGVGKVFLAHLNGEELEKALNGKGLASYTQNTVTDVKKLKRELTIVQREGVGTDDEEMEIGVRCIASPIKNSNGSVIAAISVSGPSARLSSKRIQEIKPLVRSSALEISRALGYQGE